MKNAENDRRIMNSARKGELTLDNASGAAKVLTNPAVPAVSLNVPIPLARISFDMTSAGYIGCIDVYAKAKMTPKR